eukprot:10317442-Lingulodinium_polyedra.AAC.1
MLRDRVITLANDEQFPLISAACTGTSVDATKEEVACFITAGPRLIAQIAEAMQSKDVENEEAMSLADSS